MGDDRLMRRGFGFLGWGEASGDVVGLCCGEFGFGYGREDGSWAGKRGNRLVVHSTCLEALGFVSPKASFVSK